MIELHVFQGLIWDESRECGSVDNIIGISWCVASYDLITNEIWFLNTLQQKVIVMIDVHNICVVNVFVESHKWKTACLCVSFHIQSVSKLS